MRKLLVAALAVAMLAVFFAGCFGDNQSPSAKIEISPAGIVNTNSVVIFSGNGSNDPDGSISNYTWDFGDSTHGTGSWVAHNYTGASWGTKKIKLIVIDNKDATGEATVDLVVNAAPNAQYSLTPNPRQYTNYTGMQAYDVEQLIRFDGSATSDPDTTNLNFTWDFGDTSTSNQKAVIHSYTVGGNYTVKFTVKDGYATSMRLFTLTIQDLFFENVAFTHYTDKDGYRFVNFTTQVRNNGTVMKDIGLVTLWLETFGSSGPITGGQKQANNSFKIYEKSIPTVFMEIQDVPISLSAVTTVRATLFWNGIMMGEMSIQIPP